MADRIVRLVDRLAGSRSNERTDGLTPFVVGEPDDGDLADARVSKQEILELARIDVLAAPDDHVLDAADDVAVAVVGHRGEVAGVHPAIGVDRRGGLLGFVPVPLHHRVAAGAELAGLAARQRLAGLWVRDADLDVRMGEADRLGLMRERVTDLGLCRDR